jgi:hypothetical protein
VASVSSVITIVLATTAVRCGVLGRVHNMVQPVTGFVKTDRID